MELVMSRRYAQQVANNLSTLNNDTITMANGIDVHLYVEGPTPSPDTLYSQFTEPIYPGYLASTAVAQNLANEADGSVSIIFDGATFEASGDASATQSILGLYLTPAGDVSPSYGAAQFPDPILIGQRYDGFNVNFLLNQGTPGSNTEVNVVR